MRYFFQISVWLLLTATYLTGGFVSAQDSSADARKATGIVEELAQLKYFRDPTSTWAGKIKELAEIGPAAVDLICEALRKTDSDTTMRFYAFALRAIGDPRAVPALIEAIPKTLVEPSSDCGFSVSDEELSRFMIKHDLNETPSRDHSFLLARPCREIMTTLQIITGSNQNDSELFLTFLTGGSHQQYLKRKMFHEHAVQWKEWWENHRRHYGVDMTYASVELPKFTERPSARVVDAFRSNDGVVTPPSLSETLEAVPSAKHYCFHDLDTGRFAKLPEDFDGDAGNAVDLTEWAKKNGFDLFCLPVQLAGYEEKQNVLVPVDLKAWQNASSRFDSIDGEIGKEDFELGTPVTRYLCHFDENTQRFDPDYPATFLFRTRHGICGAIQIRGQIKNENEQSVRFNLKFIYER